MSWAAQPPTDREALVTSPDPGVLLGPGPPDGQPRLAGGGPRGILGVPLSSRRALWRGKNTFQHLQILKMDFSQGNRDSEPAPFPEREPGKQRGSRGGGGVSSYSGGLGGLGGWRDGGVGAKGGRTVPSRPHLFSLQPRAGKKSLKGPPLPFRNLTAYFQSTITANHHLFACF